jgi:hypothetical protein
MLDAAQKYITESLNPMSSVEARQAIATGKVHIGEVDTPNYKFAYSLIAVKESEERAARDSESLALSRKALEISEKARSDVKWANIIAISAMILSIATAIGIAIFQWLTKK